MGKVSDMCFSLIKPYAEQLELHLVEVNYVKKFDGMHLVVVIDKKDGVDINDCEKLHRMIDQPLDDLNPTDDKPYILDVSSAGIDRPLKNDWDFEKNMGKTVTVKLFAPIEKRKEYTGQLQSYDGQNLTILLKNGSPMTFAVKQTAIISPFLDFGQSRRKSKKSSEE